MAGATTKTSKPVSGPYPKGRGIPLDLGAVLGPYAQHRLILIRLEQMPLNSFLSNGSYAGPRTWSLKPEDLHGLIYTPPEGLDGPHTLSARILSLDNNIATTLAVVEVPIGPLSDYPADSGEQPAEAKTNGDDLAAAREAWETVTKLRVQEALRIAESEAADDEISRLKDMLAASQQALADSELTFAELQGKAAAESDEALRRLREETATAHHATADSEKMLADARADFERQTEETTAKTDRETEALLKAAEQQVRDDASGTVTEAKARAEHAEAALAEIHNREDEETDEALLRLGDDLATKKQALAEASARADQAEKALAESGARAKAELAELRQLLADEEAAHGEALDEAGRARLAAEAALPEQTAEAARQAEHRAESTMKAAEKTWRADAARNLGKATARAEKAENSLAKLRSSAGNAIDDEVRRLDEDLAAARQALDETTARAEAAETTLAKAGAEVEIEIVDLWQRLDDGKAAHAAALDEARGQARAEAETSLTGKIAEAVRKTEEEAGKRLRAAEESWRVGAAHDLEEIAARADQAEAAFAELQANSEASLTEARAEFQRKHEKQAAAGQETEARLKTAEKSWRAESKQSLEEATARAEKAGAAADEETHRLAEELAVAVQALADARVEFEHRQEEQAATRGKAETTLANARSQASEATDKARRLAEELAATYEELATTRQSLTDRETALGEARAALDAKPESDPAADDFKAGTHTQGLIKKAQDELIAAAERKIAAATTRAERAESDLVKARMQVDRRSEDVVRDLESEVKTLQLALAAGESTFIDAQAEFDRRLEEQRSLYQKTAQQKADLLLREARKDWEAETRAAAAEAPAETSQNAAANDVGATPPPPPEGDGQENTDAKQGGWWRSRGGSGFLGLGAKKDP